MNNESELGHGGKPIENKGEVLDEVDRLLGVTKPPDLEIVFVEHTMRKENLGKIHQENLGRFGHAAIKYRLRNGEQYVMNISAPADHPTLVNFIDPAEYFFGIDFDKGNGAVQGGIYNRSFCGLRIENCKARSIEALHMYYQALHAKERDLKTAQFLLVGSRWKNFLRKIFPWNDSLEEYGNCTHWAANGLVWGSLMPRKHMFPKDLFVSLFEKYHGENPSNIHVVYYKEVEHSKKYYPEWVNTQSIVSPFRFLRSWYYYDLVDFSDIVIEVPKGEKKAIVIKKKGRRPEHSRLINYTNYTLIGIVLMYTLWYSEYYIPYNNIFFRLIVLFILYFFLFLD